MKKRTILKVLGAILSVAFLWVASVFIMAGRDARKVQSYCADIRPGMPVSSLASLAATHGIAPVWISSTGIFSQHTKDWLIFIPTLASMGESGCAVHHDGKIVSSAKFDQ